jgi:hypothetical protein
MEGSVDEEHFFSWGEGEREFGEIEFLLGREVISRPIDGGAGGFGEMVRLDELGGGAVVVADDGGDASVAEKLKAFGGVGVVADGVA